MKRSRPARVKSESRWLRWGHSRERDWPQKASVDKERVMVGEHAERGETDLEPSEGERLMREAL